MGNSNLRREKVEVKLTQAYVAVVGLNFNVTAEDPIGIRVEAGEPIPASIGTPATWLIVQGLVKEASDV